MQDIINILRNQFYYPFLNIDETRLHFDVCMVLTVQEGVLSPSHVHEFNLMSVIKHIQRKILDHEKRSNLHDFQMI